MTSKIFLSICCALLSIMVHAQTSVSWSRSINSESDNTPLNIFPTSNGNYTYVQYCGGTTEFTRVFILNKDGEVLNSKRLFYQDLDIVAQNCIATSDGGILLLGKITIGDSSLHYLFKLDANLAVVNAQTIDFPFFDCLAMYEASSFVYLGGINYFTNTKPWNIIVKADLIGNIKAQKSLKNVNIISEFETLANGNLAAYASAISSTITLDQAITVELDSSLNQVNQYSTIRGQNGFENSGPYDYVSVVNAFGSKYLAGRARIDDEPNVFKLVKTDVNRTVTQNFDFAKSSAQGKLFPCVRNVLLQRDKQLWAAFTGNLSLSPSEEPTNEMQLHVLLLDSNLSLLKELTIDNNSQLLAWNFVPCPDGGALLVATNYVPDGTGNKGVMIYKIDALGNVAGISTLEKEEIVSTVYPNPTTSKIRIEFVRELNSAQLNLIDSQGKLQLQTTVKSNAIELQLEHLPSGTYFYTISEQNKPIAAGKCIKQ